MKDYLPARMIQVGRSVQCTCYHCEQHKSRHCLETSQPVDLTEKEVKAKVFDIFPFSRKRNDTMVIVTDHVRGMREGNFISSIHLSEGERFGEEGTRSGRVSPTPPASIPSHLQSDR